MPLVFPKNPTDGQFYKDFYYDAASSAWKSIASPTMLESRMSSIETNKVDKIKANTLTGTKTFTAANTFAGQNTFNDTQTFDRSLGFGSGVIGQSITYSKTLSVTTSAQNIFTNANGILPVTGTYLVKINSISNWPQGGVNYEETYSGIMQWYTNTTNSDVTDQINLTSMGHANNGQYYYLRTARTGGATNTHALQMWCTSNLSSTTYNFTFTRIG